MEEGINSKKLEDVVRTIMDKDCLKILSLTVSNPMSAKEIKKQSKIPFTSLYRKITWLKHNGLIITEEIGNEIKIMSMPISILIKLPNNNNVSIGVDVKK